MDSIWTTLAANQQMLYVGTLIGAMCSLLSVYIVLRRMSLISEGVSHAGFGGFAVALLVGYYLPTFDTPIWWQIITGLFCLGTALLIGYVTRRKRVSEDAAIGIFLVTAMALGDLLLNVRAHLPSKSPMPTDLEKLLFGDFTQVTFVDTQRSAAVAIIVYAIVFLFYHQFLYTTLDEEMARINGVRTGLINVLQLALISLVIVICGRMVGFLMITALTIIPGATANMISRRFTGVMVASLLIGTLGTFAATVIAIFLGSFPAGPIVVMVLFAFFVVVWTVRTFIKPRAAIEDDAAPSAEAKAPGAFGHGHSH